MNKDYMDTLAILSFVIGVANYQENLTQNDKAEIMKKFDEQTKHILIQLEQAVEEQNKMLREILRRLEE